MKRTVKIRRVIAGVVLWIAASVCASPIVRMDIYDKADNHLLFVTFDYNASGECIGRSVFSSDSTFMRSTTFQPGTATTATKENSADYNGNLQFITTINPPSGGKTTFSTVDQFGLAQFGPSLSYAESSANTFDVTQNNATLCKEQYEFDGSGDLTRITMLDKNGAAAFYAEVRHQTVAALQALPFTALRASRVSLRRGVILVQIELSAPGLVCAELFTPAGRKALTIVNKRLPAGSHKLVSDGTTLGNGTYVVRMKVNSAAPFTRMIAVQK